MTMDFLILSNVQMRVDMDVDPYVDDWLPYTGFEVNDSPYSAPGGT